jgi:hypothetical protein
MPTQDRTGTRYERLLAFSLESLGFARSSIVGRNYLHPGKQADIVIPNTYIQPDLVLRSEEIVTAIIYSTHWSETRSSKKKFWRTWEELTQQRIALDETFLSVNCVFEALPSIYAPMLCKSVADLPADTTRNSSRPLQLEGWDAGNGWALLESFDVNILFPKGYGPIEDLRIFVNGGHDKATTSLLGRAISSPPKHYFKSQWSTLRSIKATPLPLKTPDTHSRFRIGLLHVYLLYKLLRRRANKTISVSLVIKTLTEIASMEIDVSALNLKKPFDLFSRPELDELLKALEGVFVRKGKKPEGFCRLRQFGAMTKVSLNGDLRLCVSDLTSHLANATFISAIERAFDRFDTAYGVSEAIEDLAYPTNVDSKIDFAKNELVPLVNDHKALGATLYSLSTTGAKQRRAVSHHNQNWHLELLLYLCGLNSSEDIQTRFKLLFENSTHKLRPHAPYGGHAQTVAFMLQGRDVCELWSEAGLRRTLTKEEFRTLCWKTIAQCIADAFEERHKGLTSVSSQTAKMLYLQNKSMRIISSDLNGFYILIDHYLGDLCHLQFIDDDDQEEVASEALVARVCPSWQTDMIKSLWKGTPLETWVEGVSKNGKWLIKVQSAQDGNEGHKTKELSGRCRAMHLEWLHGKDPSNREAWHFQLRSMPKVALVLDGDWDRSKKINLLEAGWDWVGDVSKLDELRALISSS